MRLTPLVPHKRLMADIAVNESEHIPPDYFRSKFYEKLRQGNRTESHKGAPTVNSKSVP